MKNILQAYRPSYLCQLWFWPPLILGGSVISAGTIHDLRRVKVPATGGGPPPLAMLLPPQPPKKKKKRKKTQQKPKQKTLCWFWFEFTPVTCKYFAPGKSVKAARVRIIWSMGKSTDRTHLFCKYWINTKFEQPLYRMQNSINSPFKGY